MSTPGPSVSFVLDGCLAALEEELSRHVSLLVYRRVSLADFLSHSAFLSYSTLQGLLCFSSRHLSALVCFLLRLRCQPLQLSTDLSLPPPFVAPLSCLAEPAKHILVLRTLLTLASHVNSGASSGGAAEAEWTSAAASVQLSLSRLLAEPSEAVSLSAALCRHIEHSALHFFVSPLAASPPLTRWTSFVHLVTGHDKKRRRHMAHAKGDVAGAADRSVAVDSDSTLSDHERLLLLSEETQQLWAALLGLLSLRCGRAAAIVQLFLPHIACALPNGGKEAVERMMREEYDAAVVEEDGDGQQQQQSAAVLDAFSLPSLPPVPLPSGSHTLPVLVALIRSLSLLQLSIASRSQCRQSHCLVSALSSLFTASSTANSTRRELAMCLSSLLSPLTLSSWSASVSYRQWFCVCQSLYGSAADWIKRHPKAKNQSLAAPLLVSALSCCDAEAFIRHFTSTIQALLLAYHSYRRKRLAGGAAMAAECRLASAASIDSLQQLLHVYLMQRASRHETTIANLETIHSAFLLSRQHSSLLTMNDEDGYAWMKGSTQDGLVALILTTAKADRNFTAHEIILPMLESQDRRRQEQHKAGASSASKNTGQQHVEGVSGQVVTGLRALAAILTLDDEGAAHHSSAEAEAEAAVGTNNKQPAPQLATAAKPTSLSAALTQLRSSLLSPAARGTAAGADSASSLTFYNPHAKGESASYLHRLAAIVGTILSQCDAVVGHILLVDQSDHVTADEQQDSKPTTKAAAVTADSAESADEDEEEEEEEEAADERRLATTIAMRLVLRVMAVIWPASLPVSQTLAMLVRAAVHSDRRTREASRRILVDMCSKDEHEADKRVSRGAIVQCVVSRINQLPNAFASSASRYGVLSDVLLLLNQMLHAWLHHSTFDSQQLEGMLLHEVEAAVGVWLAAVHPLLRLACIAVLLALRALAHQLLGYKRHHSPHTVQQRQQQQPMSAIEARDASLHQLANTPSPTRHLLADTFTACSCSPTSASLSLDSLLPNHQCAAELPAAAAAVARGQANQPALRSIAEQGSAAEESGNGRPAAVDEEDEYEEERSLEQIRSALQPSQSQRQQGQLDAHDSPASSPSASPALSSLSSAGATPALLSLDEADGADDGDCSFALQSSPATRQQSLSSLISHTSEWRWSLLLAHWMRALVTTATDTSAVPASAVAASHLSSVLSTLFVLVESRLLPFHSVHSSLCKRLKGRPPSSELSVLSAAGLPSSRLAVAKNLCLMAAAAHSLSFASASQSYIALHLLPLLSSPFSVVRRIGSVSVGNVHPSLCPPLLQLLHPLERSVSNGRDDVLRVHLSHVYRLLAESHSGAGSAIGSGSAASSGSSSTSFVVRCQAWVVSTFQWLAITGNEFRWDLLELRRHFCVVVERLAITAPVAAQTVSQQPSQSCLDDSLRRQLFSLLLAWCGHGPSSLSYSSKVDKHASELLSKLRGTSAADKAAALKASYTSEVRAFRLAALGAMAALLRTDCFDEQLNTAVQQQPQHATSCPSALDGVGFVFPWLNSVLVSTDSDVRDVAYRALEHLILHNERILTQCMAYCYHPHSMLARRYFLVIAQLMLLKCQQADSEPNRGASGAISPPASLPFALSLPCLLLLLLYKLGDASYNVRSMSLRLLPVLESRYCPQLPSAPASSLSAVVGSHLADTYRQVQLSLSTRLAATFSPLSDQLALEACRRVAAMRSADSQQQLLNCLPPWLRNIRLTRPAPSAPSAVSSVLAAEEGYLVDEQWLLDSETWEGRTSEERAAAKKADSDALRAAKPALFRQACYPTQSNQQSILSALLELTHSMHASHASRTVELMWLSFAAVKDNVAAIVHMLLAGMERRQGEADFHAETLSTHKRVALFCSRANPIATVGKLVHTIYKGADMAAHSEDRADKRGRLAVSHFALLLLVEVAYEVDFSSFDQPLPVHRQSRLSRVSSSAASALQAGSGPTASCQATLDTLSVLLHIGVLGLHHGLQFIRHHSAILLINIVHNTAFNQQHHTARALFVPSRQSDVTLAPDLPSTPAATQPADGSVSPPSRSRPAAIAARTSAYSTLTAAFSSSRSRLSSAPSAGLSLAIAESQQLRVLGVRQRRALLLMNQLNSHGRPQQAGAGQDVQLDEVVHTLLRVVADSGSRPSLSRRWWHHSVQWSVGSASSLSSARSHLVYRALSPPLLLSHYWKCIAALERHIAHWRESSSDGSGNCPSEAPLVQLLLTLQQLVGCLEVSRPDGVSLSQRQSTSASSALRCELLPSLLWSCVDVLHRAFDSPELRADSSLLVCCIRVLGACLSCARDDRHFEHAVYEWKRQRQSEQADEQLLFVGIQPLLMRCLLPADISVYSSFPTLNMLSTSAVQLAHPNAQLQQQQQQQQQALQSERPTPPSPALLTAVFSFLASFTPLPWSPLAPLLDISSFAQRVLASLLAQLPLVLQQMDETRERAESAQAALPSAHSGLPCTHAAPYLDMAGSADCVSSCQSLSTLFSSLGLLDLALVFACASAGHFHSSAEVVQSLSEPLLAVLPASVVQDACMLWLDMMERLGAFVPVEPHYHPLSKPRQPKQYTQLLPCAAADCCAAAALCGGQPTLTHYILTMVSLVLAHCDWQACQLSAVTASPLFQRLQQLLHTSLAPLAAHTLTVAMERADSEASHDSTAHQLASAVLQPATHSAVAPASSVAQPLSRYEPNPNRLSTLRDSQQPVLVVRVIDEARRESGVLRVTDSQQQQQPQRPSAPPQADCEPRWAVEEERKVQFVTDADRYAAVDKHEDGDSDSALDSSADEAALSLSLPPQFHQLLLQPPLPARPSAEAPQVRRSGGSAAVVSLARMVLPPKPASSAASTSSSLQRSTQLRPNVTTSVHRARDSSLHVDVKLSIPCLPTLPSGQDSDRPVERSGRERVAVPSSTAVASSQGGAGDSFHPLDSTASQQSSSPIAHVVKSRPRPLIRKRPAVIGNAQQSGAVLGELPLNTQQPAETNTAALAAAAAAAQPATELAQHGSIHNLQNEPSGVAPPPVKPRRSAVMCSMVAQQRERKRKEDMQRKEEELARLHSQQAHMQSQQQQQAQSAEAEAVLRTPSSQSRNLQRTLDRSAAVPTVVIAGAASAAMDVSATLREDKRKRDAEAQRLRERRVGIRDRMKEAGVAANLTPSSSRTPLTRRSKATYQSPQQPDSGSALLASPLSAGSAQAATPDAHRQSVLPCTFHMDDAAAGGSELQTAALSLDDIMAGRVNYQ